MKMQKLTQWDGFQETNYVASHSPETENLPTGNNKCIAWWPLMSKISWHGIARAVDNICDLSIFFYLCMYVSIATPSAQHFKAFLVSKINFETSLLYQLFEENSNFILLKPCEVINLSFFFHLFIYLGM